jgi:hypothetical protein
MATYATDLVFLQDGSANDSDAESGMTWVEMTGMTQGDAASEGETDYYIQGSSCASSDFNNKTGLHSSCINCGSDQSGSFSAGDVVLIWHVILPGNATDTFANGGLRAIIGASVTAWSAWKVGGNDYARNPYGGWHCYAVDPTATADYTGSGGGHAGAYQYFGAGANLLSAPSKGTQHGWDAMRYGRAEIYCTGTGCTFTGMEQENSYNDGTNGYNRWGLFQEQGGVYLWKGLMSIGQSGTSATFSDSNKTIIIDDCPATYAAFNKIEIQNASTSCTWTNITFLSLGSTAPGAFEMIADATVALTGCVFTDMSTFIFDSNATVDTCTFRRCGQVTQAASDIDDCTFDSTTAVSALLADNPNNIDGCSFTSDGSSHAIELDTACAGNSYTLTNCTYSGYTATDGNQELFNDSGGAVTITIDGGDTITNIKNGAGASTTIVSGAVSVYVKAATAAGTALQNVRIHLRALNGTGPFPFEDTVTIVNSGTLATVTHTAHGMLTNDKVEIQGASHQENNGTWTITKTGTDTYTYTMNSAPGSSPTGTITSTFVALAGLTDVNGEISTSRVYTSDQPVIGWGRKSSSSPYYKTAPLTGAVDSADGYTATAVMLLDE